MAGFLRDGGRPPYGKSYAKGAAGREDLTGEEFGQFFFLCRAIFMGCENQHYPYRQRMIDADAYRGYAATIREQIASQPGVRAMWSVVRHTCGAGFQAFLDQQIAGFPVLEACSMREKWASEVTAQKTDQP
ncbi:hypothetical protein [Thetidibacter halocola]|uniref:Uncharacterized protein n=1 Tax=Thetidibacter halocola TaxID=2827239 RepID=A0A8J7WG51_9RHOB|nr:hypothetical protein [Thetidibacter halocola]MBS0125091.1 hypothetical protein [Thetidibacter halocola]